MIWEPRSSRIGPQVRDSQYPAAFACDLHSDLQNNRTLQDNALTLLVGELMS